MFLHRKIVFFFLFQIPFIECFVAAGFLANPFQFSHGKQAQVQEQVQLQHQQRWRQEQRRPHGVLYSVSDNNSHGSPHQQQQQQQQKQQHRRSFLQNIIITTTSTAGGLSLLSPSLANAVEAAPAPAAAQVGGTYFQRVKPKLNFAYEFLPPPSVITTSNKPLQTHLDEINLPTTTRGYTYGVTVDPIRISSLRDFGTPDEVAAKIVMAELRRDGVLDVTLASDASEDVDSGGYDIEYVSDGTRGKKHFVTRTIVKEGKLFVLTVQMKEDDWGGEPALRREVMDAVRTFRVLDRGTY